MNENKKNISVTLDDDSYFETINGLWKGKKEPLLKAAVIRNTNFTNSGEIDDSDIAVIDVEEKQLITRKLSTGDIIIERSGGSDTQPVGRVVYFELEGDLPYSFSNFTTVLRCINKDELDTKYLLYYLLHLYKDGYTEKLQKRTTGIRNLDFTEYRKISVPLLNKTNQRSIRLILDLIKNKQDILDKQLSNYKQLKQSLMERLFTQGLYGEEFKETETGIAPSMWVKARIGDVVAKHENVSSDRNDQEFSYIDVSAISNEFFRIESFVTDTLKNLPSRAKRIVESGDIIYATVRPYLKRIALISPEYGGFLVSTAFCVMHPISEKIDSYFLYYYLQRPVVNKNIESLQTGASYPAVSDKDILNQDIYLPPLKEQKSIANTIYTIDKKISLLNAKHILYKNLFNSMLHKLMNQEIDVENLEIGNL